MFLGSLLIDRIKYEIFEIANLNHRHQYELCQK